MVVRRRLDITGRAMVFVTTTVADWRPLFADRELARICLYQLAETAQYFEVSIVGYVVMPSHLHALLGFKRIELLSKFMQSFKIPSAKKIKELFNEGPNTELMSGNTWRPRFDDLIIFSGEQFRIKLNYIHNNPVKAGLANSPEEWVLSSAGDWLNSKPGLIKIDKEFEWTKWRTGR